MIDDVKDGQVPKDVSSGERNWTRITHDKSEASLGPALRNLAYARTYSPCGLGNQYTGLGVVGWQG